MITNKQTDIWLGNWVASWLDVICGAISVITFCAWRPWWDFTFRAYWAKKSLKNSNLIERGESNEQLG